MHNAVIHIQEQKGPHNELDNEPFCQALTERELQQERM